MIFKKSLFKLKKAGAKKKEERKNRTEYAKVPVWSLNTFLRFLFLLLPK